MSWRLCAPCSVDPHQGEGKRAAFASALRVEIDLFEHGQSAQQLAPY